MKKILFLCSIIILALFPTVTSANYPTTAGVIINGEEKNFSPRAIIVNGNTMVPFRQIFDTYGATVNWDSKTKTITATKDDIEVILNIDSRKAYVNKKEFILSQTPFIGGDGHTFVNLRFISETLGAKVFFERSPKPTVYIKY